MDAASAAASVPSSASRGEGEAGGSPVIANDIAIPSCCWDHRPWIKVGKPSHPENRSSALPALERFELDESFESFAPPPPPDGPELQESAHDSNAAPVIQLADRILLQALTRKASDIHIEPQEDGLHVRLRLDGVLQNAFETLPAKVIPALTSRFKIMAELDIAERRQPCLLYTSPSPRD